MTHYKKKTGWLLEAIIAWHDGSTIGVAGPESPIMADSVRTSFLHIS